MCEHKLFSLISLVLQHPHYLKVGPAKSAPGRRSSPSRSPVPPGTLNEDHRLLEHNLTPGPSSLLLA